MINRNHKNKHEKEVNEPRASQAGLLAGLLAELLIGGLAGAVAMLVLVPRLWKKTQMS